MLIHDVECILCLLDSRIRELSKCTYNFNKVQELLNYIQKISQKKLSRTELFFNTYLYVLDLCNCNDLHIEEKKLLRNSFQNYLKYLESESNLINFVKYIALANNVDIEMRFYKLSSEVKLNFEDCIFYNITEEEILNLFKSHRNILYLLDNTGEHLVDLMFIKYLLNHGYNVWLAVKSKPYEIDVTYNELKNDLDNFSLKDIHVIILPSNKPIFSEIDLCNRTVSKIGRNCLIVSKGIANLESYIENFKHFSELNILFLFSCKCLPLSKIFNIPLGKSIIVHSEFVKKLFRKLISG